MMHSLPIFDALEKEQEKKNFKFVLYVGLTLYIC